MEREICLAIAREIGKNVDTETMNLGLLVLSSALLTLNTFISRRAQLKANEIQEQIAANGREVD